MCGTPRILRDRELTLAELQQAPGIPFIREPPFAPNQSARCGQQYILYHFP